MLKVILLSMVAAGAVSATADQAKSCDLGNLVPETVQCMYGMIADLETDLNTAVYELETCQNQAVSSGQLKAEVQDYTKKAQEDWSSSLEKRCKPEGEESSATIRRYEIALCKIEKLESRLVYVSEMHGDVAGMCSGDEGVDAND